MITHTSKITLLAFAAVAFSTAALQAQNAESAFYGLGRGLNYVQTSDAAPVLLATDAASFEAFSDGGTLTVRTPAGATSGEIDRSFASKAAMDAAFPDGTYTLGVGGVTGIAIPLLDLYPAQPPRVMGGTWNSRGQLVVAPARDYVLTLSPFTEYGTTGALAVSQIAITRFVNGSNQSVLEQVNFSSEQPGPITTLRIPAGTLTAGQTYFVEVGWDLASTLNTTSVAGQYGVAACGRWLEFTLSAETPAAAAPTFAAQPASRTVAPGGTAAFTVVVNGQPAPTLQWRRNGTAIVGATAATLVVSGASAIAGDYTVVATNTTGTITSAAATLTLDATADTGRLINLSVLTDIVTAGDVFTMGYVVGGSGTSGAKPLVIRAAGPSLGALGVPGTVADPKMELFAGSTKTGDNDNWGGSAALTAAMAAVGAFPYAGPTSLDAASIASIATRDNSVKVAATGSGTGRVIAELYEATPAGSFAAATPRLVNVSVLKHLARGLTAGFVIGGATAKTVLVRAIGPTLGAAPFNVPGVVADPQLTLYAGSTAIASNDDWAGSAALAAAFSSVGAFALPAASRDAAILITLAPGSYSVEVMGTSGTSGTALIEVYEVP